MKSSSSAVLTESVIRKGEVPARTDLVKLFALNKRKLQSTIKKLSKINSRQLDEVVHTLHHQAFSFYDCLQCANCCRTISSAISHHDVEQLSGKIKL